ncbi:hypothetical protein PF008_g24787 [Phytophthora fragariae]|uniref:Uncharacterized protein n=1 Tax=Phytophthora fragariae TaxID=53985 RepID=A0A6G0QMH6_9STRA|nr:hypothetical protein PF008_g24787 [Phytophthora fragariae]
MEILADLELDAEDQRAHHQLQELDAALEILADLGLDADRKDGDEQGGGGELVADGKLEAHQELGANLERDVNEQGDELYSVNLPA